MKRIDIFLQEKLQINNNSKVKRYNYHPKNKEELITLIDKLIDERGENADLNDIDVSNITDMSKLFYNIENTIREIDISKWDVSNVTNMKEMFFSCPRFNCNISSWDVSKVEDMKQMFYGCNNFNCNLDNWKVSKDTNILYMFTACLKNKKIPDWYKNR